MEQLYKEYVKKGVGVYAVNYAGPEAMQHEAELTIQFRGLTGARMPIVFSHDIDPVCKEGKFIILDGQGTVVYDGFFNLVKMRAVLDRILAAPPAAVSSNVGLTH